jgi:hypothetical protein
MGSQVPQDVGREPTNSLFLFQKNTTSKAR